MVRMMTDEELKNLPTGLWTKFRLYSEEIQEWKENGYFKHIKKELENIPNVRFGCMQQDDGTCIYCFVFYSSKLRARFSWMVRDLMNNKQVRLTQESNSETSFTSSGNFSGTPKACNLF